MAYNENNIFNLAFLLETHYCCKQKNQLFYIHNRIVQIIKHQKLFSRNESDWHVRLIALTLLCSGLGIILISQEGDFSSIMSFYRHKKFLVGRGQLLILKKFWCDVPTLQFFLYDWILGVRHRHITWCQEVINSCGCDKKRKRELTLSWLMLIIGKMVGTQLFVSRGAC